MRTLLNLLIMGFVVYAVYYQVKHNNFPQFTEYFKNAESSFVALKGDVPDSLKNIFAPLWNITSQGGIKTLTDLNTSATGEINLNSLGTLLSPLTNAISNAASGLLNGGQLAPIAPPDPAADLQKIVLPGALNVTPVTETKTNTKTDTSVKSDAMSARSSSTSSKSTEAVSPYISISGIVSKTNVERQQNGASTLKESAKLDASALVKAKDILARQYFEHQSPDGKLVSDLVSAQNYSYLKIGENLALGNFGNDQDVVTAWMNSPGHRANIVDPSFTEIGVGVTYGMYQGRLVSVAVQHFGRPSSQCPSVSNSLHAQVETGEKELNSMSASLTAMKNEIDQGQANGQDVNTKITLYNNGVGKYQSEFVRIEALRTEYNAEVTAFNTCLSAANR